MVMVISSDGTVDDATRRQQIFDGRVFCLSPRASVAALAEFAWELITDAFGDRDPMVAHQEMTVEQYVAVLGPLKTGFTHHPRSKELVRELLVGVGADPTDTYFDVPKLRVVAPASYLTAGLGYNYTPHRDVWYSAPQCQVNWWAPIRGVTDRTAMSFHPDFWQRQTENTSSDFDAYEWNKSARRDAVTFITTDPRPHPRLKGQDPGTELRVVGEPGSILSFSAAQLHATVPNTTDRARLSFDFRTVNLHDVVAHAGPENIDAASTGTTLRDFRCAETLELLPADVIETYDIGGSSDGVLVFDPSVLQS